MNKFCGLILLLFITFGASAGEKPTQEDPSKSCTIGPTEKTFGKTKWLLYGCNDATTAVIVSAEGNPASPFYFIIFRDADNYRIYGEGIGNKTASAAALKDLQAMSGAALAGLVSEATRPKQ
jgi:hypothetical protein